MAEIRLLDSNTIDKIAAGEVVERPSSVVKELVENAMDAGADAITVEIRDGGCSFIRVTDNGDGIEKEQIRKAFFRHATSKISTAEDLYHIHSLGFRGEALSSIAAVSMVELITKTADTVMGSRYVLEGGEEKTLDFELDEKAFRLMGLDYRWTVEPGEFRILAGASSRDIRCETQIVLSAEDVK